MTKKPIKKNGDQKHGLSKIMKAYRELYGGNETGGTLDETLEKLNHELTEIISKKKRWTGEDDARIYKFLRKLRVHDLNDRTSDLVEAVSALKKVQTYFEERDFYKSLRDLREIRKLVEAEREGDREFFEALYSKREQKLKSQIPVIKDRSNESLVKFYVQIMDAQRSRPSLDDLERYSHIDRSFWHRKLNDMETISFLYGKLKKLNSSELSEEYLLNTFEWVTNKFSELHKKSNLRSKAKEYREDMG